MTAAELDFMIALAQDYERRFRDKERRGHCLSIEHRYDSGAVWDDDEQARLSFCEDALCCANDAWVAVSRSRTGGNGLGSTVNMLCVSFGIGYKSQTAAELALNRVISIFGQQYVDEKTNEALSIWHGEIKRLAGENYQKWYKSGSKHLNNSKILL